MRIKFFVLLVLVLGLTGCEKAPEMTEYISEQGKFSVLTHKNPKKEVLSLGEDGEIPATIYEFTIDDDLYEFSYMDLDTGMSDEEVLDLVQGAMTGKRTVISVSDIDLDGIPGREISTMNPSEGSFSFARIYLSGIRVYQQVVTSTGGERTREMTKFMESFKVLD